MVLFAHIVTSNTLVFTSYMFIIIIIIIILVITFMQAIYNYIPETNHVSTVYSVAAVLYLQFVLHVMLFLPRIFIIIVIIIIITLLSSLCRLFTIICLKQIRFLLYIVM